MNKKEQAVKLRQFGLSYSQIQSELGISKSTLSLWLKTIALSDEAQEKINKRVNNTSRKALILRNKARSSVVMKEHGVIRKEAAKEFVLYFQDPLFIAGISLYWAEGYKKGASGSRWKSIDLANSDPQMILFMVHFFKKYLGVSLEKMKIQIIAHDNIDIDASVRYWSQLTGIPSAQFIKTSVLNRERTSKNPRKHSLTHGTIHVRINDVKLFFRLIGWLDGLQDFLKKSV